MQNEVRTQGGTFSAQKKILPLARFANVDISQYKAACPKRDWHSTPSFFGRISAERVLMNAYASPEMRSRRYGTSHDISASNATLQRISADQLSSSLAEPPPDVFAPATQTKSETLLSALHNLKSNGGAMYGENDDEWTDSEPDALPSNASEPKSMKERCFLTEYHQRELQQQSLLEGMQTDSSIMRKVPVPTVSDEEDVEAPKNVFTEQRIRTAMEKNLDETVSPPSEAGAKGEVPVADAAAAALERLVNPAEDEVKPVRRKKVKKSTTTNDGEPKKKKKKERSVTKDAKKSVKKTSHNAPNEGHEPEPIADLLHEPVADPVPAESQEEQVLEPDVTTTVAYFSADVPKPTMGETNSPTVTKSQPADIPSHTPPNAVAERAPPNDASQMFAMGYAAARTERGKMHLFNYNATRLAVSTYILYWGMFATLRKLWRWENPWVTGSMAMLYLVVWWRGDLLAVFFLAACLYVATFRIWQVPGSEQDNEASRATGAPSSLTRPGTDSQSLLLLAPSHETLQQVGDQVLVVAHGLADVQERVKNLMMWRNPIMTLRYLGWLILFGLLSVQATTWMLMRLPGALIFVLLFILAPMIEYGHWRRTLELLCGITGVSVPDPAMPYPVTRTLLDSILVGVPTDEEYLHEKLAQTHWEAERELRRLGQWIDANRIVEAKDDESTNRYPSSYAGRSESSSLPRERHPSAMALRPEKSEPKPPNNVMHDRVEVESLSDYGSQLELAATTDNVDGESTTIMAHDNVQPYVMAHTPWNTQLESEHVPAPQAETPTQLTRADAGLDMTAQGPVSVQESSRASHNPLTASSSAPMEPSLPVVSTSDAPAAARADSRAASIPLHVPPSLLTSPPRTSGPPISRHASYSTLRESVMSSPLIPAQSETLPSFERQYKHTALMSPPVPTQAMYTVSSPTPSGLRELPAMGSPPQRPHSVADGLYLAVFRKRLGHMIVLPTRVVFLMTYGPHRRTTPPPGLSLEEEEDLVHTVHGRPFYPMLSPDEIVAMVEDEMAGRGQTEFEIAAVPLARMPQRYDILFEVPIERIRGLKKLRKSTPVLEECTEGLEMVLGEHERGIGLPAVIDRDLACQRILALGPQRWAW